MAQATLPSRDMAHRGAKSSQLLEVLSAYPRLLIVGHDTPDPDAIATGWAVHHLVREKLGAKARFVARGMVLRAENRHMLKLLRPPIELVQDVRVTRGTGAILVDCGPAAENHLLCYRPVETAAVIDHHIHGRRLDVPFRDIRPRAVASASIATSYLREQEVEPSPELATALLYAIRTEAYGSESAYSRVDRSATLWLTERAEPSYLAEIENAPLSGAYFGDLVLALQSTRLFKDAAFCLMPRADNPEIIGEVADLLIRGEGIRRVLCGAVVGRDLCVSVRTEADNDSATRLVRATLRGLGHGGGHPRRAGGKIPNIPGGTKGIRAIKAKLRRRWLRACGVDQQRGVRLIARREIVGNL